VGGHAPDDVRANEIVIRLKRAESMAVWCLIRLPIGKYFMTEESVSIAE
jgi:hypothetical protein